MFFKAKLKDTTLVHAKLQFSEIRYAEMKSTRFGRANIRLTDTQPKFWTWLTTTSHKELQETAKHIIMEPNDVTILFVQMIFGIFLLLILRCMWRTSICFRYRLRFWKRSRRCPEAFATAMTDLAGAVRRPQQQEPQARYGLLGGDA